MCFSAVEPASMFEVQEFLSENLLSGICIGTPQELDMRPFTQETISCRELGSREGVLLGDGPQTGTFFLTVGMSLSVGDTEEAGNIHP